MAKRTWNPGSAVNQQHLCGMLAKGTTHYHTFCADIFAAKASGEAVAFEELVRTGEEDGYFSSKQVDQLLGTSNSKQVAEAASSNAQATLISGLANGGMHPAVASLLTQGAVTVDQVGQVYSALGKDLPPSIVKAIDALTEAE